MLPSRMFEIITGEILRKKENIMQMMKNPQRLTM
jgi:hypothetical protein